MNDMHAAAHQAPAVSQVPAVPQGLIYACDDTPGICRLRRGCGFSYRQPDGSRLSDMQQLARIRKLAIPPAYTTVWICLSPQGHLQATGRDTRGRKQYIYHPEWRRARDETKFDRMLEFGAALPRIRSRVRRDLDAAPGSAIMRQAVIAAIVHLLDTTLMRVGNDEYARNNGSFGLTTLRKRHAAISGIGLRLRFRGKSGIMHEVALQDRRIVRIVRRCQALPGQELFQYLDEAGNVHSVGSMEVNDYLRSAGGGEFTAKDFRTWHGSVHALRLWRQSKSGGAEPATAMAKRLLAEVAQRLGNTVTVCRKSYVHPRVLALITGATPGEWPCTTDTQPRKAGLSAAENAFLALLNAAE